MSLKLAIETTYDGSGFEKLSSDQKKSESDSRRVSSASISSNSKIQDSLKKTAQVGTATFASVRAAAQTAGSAMGPVAGSIASVFTSLTAGGIVAAGVSVAMGGLAYVISQYTGRAKEAEQAQKEFSESFRELGVATDQMYVALEKAQNGLTQTQLKLREVQLALGSGMIPVLNIATGQWEKYSAAVVNAQSGTMTLGIEIKATETLLREAPTTAQYALQIKYLQEAITNASDSIARASLQDKLREINRQILDLRGVNIAPPDINNISAKISSMLLSLSQQVENGPPIIIPVTITPNPNQGIFGPTKEEAEAYLSWEAQQNQQRVADFYEASSAIRAGWDTALSGMMAGTMRAGEIWQGVWTSVSQTFVQQISRMLWAKMASLAAISAAEKTHAATSSALENRQTTMSIGRATVQALAWLKVAAAKLAAWFASLGPFGIVALGGTIAALVAMIRGVKMQSGGIVPGRGFGDKTPALLEPGEFVVNRRASQNNRSALEAMNSGKSISNSNTANVTANITVNGGMNAGEMLSFREQLRMHLKSVFEELAYSGSFRPGLVGGTV